MNSDLDRRFTRSSFSLLAPLLVGATLTVSGCALVDKVQGDRYATQQTKEAQQEAAAPVAPPPTVAIAPPTAPPPAPEPPPAAIEPPAVAAGLALAVGTYSCELNRDVIVKSISSDGKSLVLGWSGQDHTLEAVRAQSGALRYDGKESGLSWITIVGKSLLLNVKIGQQLANECKYASASTTTASQAATEKMAPKRPAKRGTAKKEG